MVNIGRLKNRLFYYRYNILWPTLVGSIIFVDYFNLKRKRRAAVAQEERRIQREAKKRAEPDRLK